MARLIAASILLLTCILLEGAAKAQPVPTPTMEQVSEGITYYYWPGNSISCGIAATCLRMHAVVVERNRPEYELRVLAAEDSSTATLPPNHRQILTRTVESFANESVPQAIVALNGAIWRAPNGECGWFDWLGQSNPANGCGRQRNEHVLPSYGLVLNQNIISTNVHPSLNREVFISSDHSFGHRIGARRLVRESFMEPAAWYYAFGTGTSLLRAGVCRSQDIDEDIQSIFGIGESRIIFFSMDHSATETGNSALLCRYLSNLGATEAVVLDGGRSAQLYLRRGANSGIVNPLHSSRIDGGDRHVSSAIAIVRTGATRREVNCQDNIDNDGDGSRDCMDSDCPSSACGFCTATSCSNSSASRTARIACNGICSDECHSASGTSIRMSIPSNFVPCDNGGGAGVHSWHGVSLQDVCTTPTCAQNTPGSAAVIFNPRSRQSFLVQGRIWTLYKCLEVRVNDGNVSTDLAIYPGGPSLLGAPKGSATSVGTGIVERQEFEGGEIWFGTDLNWHLHVNRDTDSVRTLLRSAVRISSSCANVTFLWNSPGPSDCSDDSACRLTNSFCASEMSRRICLPFIDNDPCLDLAPDPQYCGTGTVCSAGECLNCGSFGELCCASNTTRCRGELNCNQSTGRCIYNQPTDGGVAADGGTSPVDSSGIDTASDVPPPGDVGCQCVRNNTNPIALCIPANRLVERECLSNAPTNTCGYWNTTPINCAPGYQCIDGLGCRACGGNGERCCPSGSVCASGLTCQGSGADARCRTPVMDAGVVIPCAHECPTEGELRCASETMEEICSGPTATRPCRHWSPRNTCPIRNVCTNIGGGSFACTACGDGGLPCCAARTCNTGRICLSTGRCSNVCTAEICDGQDNDCDGMIDEGDLSTLCAATPYASATACNSATRRTRGQDLVSIGGK